MVLKSGEGLQQQGSATPRYPQQDDDEEDGGEGYVTSEEEDDDEGDWDGEELDPTWDLAQATPNGRSCVPDAVPLLASLHSVFRSYSQLRIPKRSRLIYTSQGVAPQSQPQQLGR